MDIEGHEYEWLEHLKDEYMNKFRQITLEVHGINDDSWLVPYEQKVRVLEKLDRTHLLVHVHGNNYAGVSPKTNVPDVLELTYVHKDCLGYFPRTPNRKSLPLPMTDFPNNPNVDDHSLNFPPFVE